jgi:uncharacterized protein YndB with AHSA1/START domain
MTDLRLERDFPVTAQKLYDWISTPDKLLQWWGPEGMHVPVHNLDFSRTGPWYSVMQNSEGQQYKVSGHVTHVDPPRSVGFTWAWHDESDARGDESHVTFTVEGSETGSRLILDHRDLGDDERSASHEKGWASTLRKLAAQIS